MCAANRTNLRRWKAVQLQKMLPFVKSLNGQKEKRTQLNIETGLGMAINLREIPNPALGSGDILMES